MILSNRVAFQTEGIPPSRGNNMNALSMEEDINVGEVIMPPDLYDGVADFNIPDFDANLDELLNGMNMPTMDGGVAKSPMDTSSLEGNKFDKEIIDLMNKLVSSGNGNGSGMDFGDLDPNKTNDQIDDLMQLFRDDFNEEHNTSPTVFYTLVCLYGVVIFVGIIGNGVILWAILGKNVMRTARNYFIVSLAVSDLLLCLMTMPLTLWEVLR